MYSFDSRVRYSEVNENCQMELNNIIDYFQDCSCFQSEDLNVSMNHLKELHCAWLLNSWQIIVNRFPMFGEKITTSTWAYGFDSIYGYRNFMMKNSDGEILAVANSNWIYVDILNTRICKLTEDVTSPYPIEPKYEGMEYASRKIRIPKESTEYDSILVMPHHIDSNHHMNNGQYVKLAEQYLPKDFKIKQMRAEYKQQALLGNVMIPRVSVDGQVCTIVFVNPDNRPYCIIEFTEASSF